MYLVARLVDDCLPERELSATARTARSISARGWLANVALPTPVRVSLIRLADTTGGDLSEISAALTTAIAAVDHHLDPASRSELGRLERAFTGHPGA